MINLSQRRFVFTIRGTLIGLFLLLGAGLCALVSLQAWATVLQFREAQDLTLSNSAREQLARTGMAVAEERTEAYLSLLGASGVEKSAAELRATADQVFEEAVETLSRVESEDQDVVLGSLWQDLADLRSTVDQSRSINGPQDRAASAAKVLAGYSRLLDDLVSLRVALLTQEHPADAGTANAFQMRRYATILLEGLALNEALIGGLVVEASPAAQLSVWDQIRGNAERAELAFELLMNRAGSPDRSTRLKLAALTVAYQDRYHPLEQQLLEALAEPAAAQDGIQGEAYGLLWSTRQITRLGADLQESLFVYSRDRLAQQQRRAFTAALLWLGVLVLGLGLVAQGAWVVVRRVIQPLDQLRHSMLALAGGDLKATLPNHARPDEVGAMADALRVFKANAIRRARLQEERHALHESLQGAHRQLERDLEAASAVQLSLLPEPARLGGVAFRGQLRPSHFISGDTYDVLRQPNGAVHFFLADVAGHGAAAALVSVASRYAAAQTILQRQAGDSLAGVLAALNDDWPEHLPYFTMLMGELRPEEGRGTLVQAGHPPPILLRRSGSVEMIGHGGLPIGVLRGATFDEVTFSFEPGDRLLVYSDGLSEAEDPSGQPFTEERLLEVMKGIASVRNDDLLAAIAKAVRDWCKSDKMDDDMTLLVLEGVTDDATDWRIAAE